MDRIYILCCAQCHLRQYLITNDHKTFSTLYRPRRPAEASGGQRRPRRNRRTTYDGAGGNGAAAAPHQSCRITKISIASSFISPLWLPQNVVALEKAKHATHGKSKRPSRWSKPFEKLFQQGITLNFSRSFIHLTFLRSTLNIYR